MEIFFVTTNKNKLREARQITGINLKNVALNIHEIQAVNVAQVVEEKAKQAYEKVRKPVVVDDTGFFIKAWGGFPGALSKWLFQYMSNDEICKMLGGKNHTAVAHTIVCLYDGKKFRKFSGKVIGSIAKRPRGANGFGWDQIFIPTVRK